MITINEFSLGKLVGYSAHTKDNQFFDDDVTKELAALGIEQISMSNDFKTIYWQGELSDIQLAGLKLSLEQMVHSTYIIFPKGANHGS